MSSTPTPGPETGVLGGLSPDVVLDAVIEASDDAIFTCGTGGSITTWGSTASRVFGRDGADAVGMHLSALFADHLRDGVSALSRRVATGDVIRHFETEVLRGDGMPIPISLSVRPVHDRDGYVVGSVVVASDITEQRLAQAALAEVEARLAEGEALAGTGSWMWDVRTGAVQW
ncbi:MAG: PAS domain-containing protein, partial [Acidimicrobiales bacterium]